MSEKSLYIVHAVDVEGPMTETLEATFERMYEYGLPKLIPPSSEVLQQIQAGQYRNIDSNLADQLKRVFNKHSLAYLTSWDQINSSIKHITSPGFRTHYCSKDGSPYKYSWFIYDHHEGFIDNPRFHAVGTHVIYDHYVNNLLGKSIHTDGIYWHYHHPAPSGHALESGTCWSQNSYHEEIIAKRIIDRQWYFSCFRAGLHIERNDLSHWLEMFIPFDFSARYSADPLAYPPGSDIDWRGCPRSWRAWHPDWYDYRREGTMRRYLFRCADLATYHGWISSEQVEEAFQQASREGSAVLTYYNHDYRIMSDEIDHVYALIRSVGARYPDVDWKFCTALEAAQGQLNLAPSKPSISYHLNHNELHVEINQPIFGPQPFLAIKENGNYFRDNFTAESTNCWSYCFRNLHQLEAFGIAANSLTGDYDVVTWS